MQTFERQFISNHVVICTSPGHWATSSDGPEMKCRRVCSDETNKKTTNCRVTQSHVLVMSTRRRAFTASELDPSLSAADADYSLKQEEKKLFYWLAWNHHNSHEQEGALNDQNNHFAPGVLAFSFSWWLYGNMGKKNLYFKYCMSELERNIVYYWRPGSETSQNADIVTYDHFSSQLFTFLQTFVSAHCFDKEASAVWHEEDEVCSCSVTEEKIWRKVDQKMSKALFWTCSLLVGPVK